LEGVETRSVRDALMRGLGCVAGVSAATGILTQYLQGLRLIEKDAKQSVALLVSFKFMVKTIQLIFVLHVQFILERRGRGKRR